MSDLNGNNTGMTELFDWFTYDPRDLKPYTVEAEVEAAMVLHKASDPSTPKSFRNDGSFAVKPDDNIVGIGFHAFINYLKHSSGYYGLEFNSLATDGVTFFRARQ